MQRDLRSRGLVFICAMSLAVGAAACGGGTETESPADQEAMDMSEAPAQDPAVGEGMQEARVSGCLQRGEIDGTFVLTEARAEGEAGSVGTTGLEATAGQYRLVHTGDADLSEHVGNRVTITGRFQSTGGTLSGAETGIQTGSGAPAADPAPRDDLGADTTGGGTEGTAGAATQIVVENVERADGECAAQ